MKIIPFFLMLLTAQFCYSDTCSGDSWAPENRYRANGDEVLDSQTDIVWKRCAEGMSWNGTTCTGTPLEIRGYREALRYLQSHTDGRLPSIDELATLRAGRVQQDDDPGYSNYGCSLPALNTRIFPGNQIIKGLAYLSSSSGSMADLSIDFDTGLTKGGALFAMRLIRKGQVVGPRLYSGYAIPTPEKHVQDQQEAFKRAKTRSDLETFIKYYKDYDRAQLVGTARQKILDDYRTSYRNATSSRDFADFIRSYNDYDPDNYLPAAEKKRIAALAREKLEAYRQEYRNASTSSQLAAFIEKYSNDDPDKIIPQARKKQKEAERQEQLARYRKAFQQAYSSSDFSSFINQYSNNDPDKLIPQARKNMALAAQREHEAYLREVQAAEARRQQQIAEQRSIEFVSVRFYVTCGILDQCLDKKLTLAPADNEASSSFSSTGSDSIAIFKNYSNNLNRFRGRYYFTASWKNGDKFRTCSGTIPVSGEKRSVSINFHEDCRSVLVNEY